MLLVPKDSYTVTFCCTCMASRVAINDSRTSAPGDKGRCVCVSLCAEKRNNQKNGRRRWKQRLTWQVHAAIAKRVLLWHVIHVVVCCWGRGHLHLSTTLTSGMLHVFSCLLCGGARLLQVYFRALGGENSLQINKSVLIRFSPIIVWYKHWCWQGNSFAAIFTTQTYLY